MIGTTVATHGVLRRNVPADAIDEHLEELEIAGFTVVESGFSPARIDDLRARLDRLLPLQQDGFAKDTDIVRCPLAFDPAFLEVATNASLLAICRRLFGASFVLLQQNGIANRPHSSEYQAHWHRDLSYQHFVVSRKIAINALLCIDDFTEETGGTCVVPATHRCEDFPSDRYVLRHQMVATAKAGSLLVMDAMLFHRSGHNSSTGSRRGVNHLIGLPFLAQQVDIPRLLGRDPPADPFLNRYLGYRWNPAPDVATWRERRGEPTPRAAL